MNRKEMLNILHKTTFCYIDPPSEWEDIGFTERPIWVNSEGYGYIACDENIESGDCEGISAEKWDIILEKINEGTLMISDIEGTSLINIFDEYVDDFYMDFQDTEEESEKLTLLFSGLKEFSIDAPKHIWWMEYPEYGYHPLMFFVTKEAFDEAYERDDYDYSWDELDDDMLAEWIKRLANNN